MRTFNEILDENIDRSIMSPAEEKAIHKSMKEAREEYAKEFLKFIVDTDFTQLSTKEFYLMYKGKPYRITHDQLIEIFDKHLEEERGKK